MYHLQRCRSHNVNDTPRTWETLQTGPEADIVREYIETRKTLAASGDIFRITDADGNPQSVLTESTCGPTLEEQPRD